MDFNKYLEKQLKDSEFKKEYDALGPEYEIISAVIKARKELGMTQSDLAKAIGTDQSRISKLEKGLLNPSLEFLKKLADGIGKKVHISFE